MPWHRSLSNPRKVYNERHEQACICETPEQATLIVEAVNQFVPKPNALASTERRAEPEQTRVRRDEDDDGSFAIV